ncbi:MAG TPA: lipoyl synthase [Gammaproteobacteria bacterium]|nr:lipoyl synthase [Gammaproteobacteria bacterium]
MSLDDPTQKLKGEEKFKRLPTKIRPQQEQERQRLPAWIRIRAPIDNSIAQLKGLLREHKLHTVCEEASCPNLSECFSHGTATVMIAGDKCTRRCTFCDVAHGRPDPLDPQEPKRLAEAIAKLHLKYIVITSVDRDDLRDGGASHFAECIKEVRELSPQTKIEVLVPDFRGRMDLALEKLQIALPDVFNHNLETIPALYPTVRPGSDYKWSLNLIKQFKQLNPSIPTKSGLMLGLGEDNAQIIEVLHELRNHDCDWLTLGQYLQPSKFHHPVKRYVHPDEFVELKQVALDLGFTHVASGPLVRSSYHADLQARGEVVK